LQGSLIEPLRRYVGGVVPGADEATLHAERALRVARDHGVWVVVSSFAGPTGGGYTETAGRSSIWRFDGAQVATTGPEQGANARAELTTRE